MGTAKWAEVEIEPETSAWLLAHRHLSRLALERAAADAEEGRWLLAALRSAAHLHLGFASFSEYVERSFGYKPRSTQEKLRVAEALEQLPVLTQALQQGTVHWSAVRELTRVAVPENEHAWLAVAHGKTLRQLEDLVAGKIPGDDPSSPPRASERRHVLRFEVAPETFALFREALTALRRSTDNALDDDAALLALARLALGGPRDEGRASYQIAVTLCAACGQGHQPTNGELVPIGPEIVAMAHCDGQHLGCISPHAANDGTPSASLHPNHHAHVGANVHAEGDPVRAPASSSAPAAEMVRHAPAHVGANIHSAEDPVRAPRNSSVRAAEMVRHAHAHVGADLDAEHDSVRASKSSSVRASGMLPDARARVGAKVSLTPNPGPALPRAQQTTPPALRRAILARDHRRCRVPGCRNSVFVDLHHLQLRSEGGPNDPQNLITLCGAHHRAAHRGQLLIDGTATTVRFRHADGGAYGRVAEPQALEARAKTFRALRGLGFREGDVRAVLAQLERAGELAAGTVEQWVRAALARLTPPRSRP